MAKKAPEQQLKSFVEVRRWLPFILIDDWLRNGQKTPNDKFTFDSARDSPESEICREAGKDARECIKVRE